jgi:phage host-nuclease inhibitor protein Gam
MTLDELKIRMNKIKDKLKALEKISPRNEEELETILEQVGRLQREGFRLGQEFVTRRSKVKNG